MLLRTSRPVATNREFSGFFVASVERGIFHQRGCPGGGTQGVNVDIGGQHVFIYDPVLIFGDADPAVHMENQIVVIARPVDDARIMKFMALYFRANRINKFRIK